MHPGEREEEIPYLRYMSQAGRRVAELHVALAGNSELAEFAPEPTGRDDVQHWIDDLMLRAGRVFDALRQRRDTLKEADRPLADQVLALQRRPAGSARARCCCTRGRRPPTSAAMATSISNQVADRQGRYLHHRLRRRARRAVSPNAGARRAAARDVASLIRSIDYSATAALERALKVGPR